MGRKKLATSLGGVLLAILLTVPLVAACAAPTPAPAPAPAPAPEPAPAPAPAVGTVTVQEYWDMYGQIPHGDWYVDAQENIEWWKPSPSRQYKLAAAVPHLKDPWWLANVWGLKQAAEELNLTIDLRAATGYGDLEGQMRIMDDFMIGDYDGISFAGVDSVGMTPSVEKAWEEGIFVSYNAVPTEDKRATRSAYNEYNLGYAIGKGFADRWPGKKVVALKGAPGMAWADLIGDPMIEGLETDPTMEILEAKYHEMDLPAIMSLTEDILTTYPEVEAIICSTDFATKGVVAGLRAAGKEPGDVLTTGEPIDPEGIGLMREGWYNLASTTEAVLGARLSVWVLVHMLEGNPVPANIYLPVRVITEETLDDEIAQGLEGKEYSPEGWVPGPVLGE